MFEMNENQKALFDKLTTLQQEVALNSISGMNDIDSYNESSGKAETDGAKRVSVSQILTNHNVVVFIDSMKAIAVNDAVMSRERMMEVLTLLSDISALDTDDLTATKLVELKDGFNVKLKAMKQLADLGGYNSAAKFDHTSSDGSMSPVQNMTDEELIRIANE